MTGMTLYSVESQQPEEGWPGRHGKDRIWCKLMMLICTGRQTGSEEWKAERGETGPVQASSRQASLPGTRWRMARDEGLKEQHPYRICKGAIRASGENAPSETAMQVRCSMQWHGQAQYWQNCRVAGPSNASSVACCMIASHQGDLQHAVD